MEKKGTALTVSVSVRLRNRRPVLGSLWLLARAARWLKPATVVRWGTAALKRLTLDARLDGRPWGRVEHGLRMALDEAGTPTLLT